MSTHTDGASAAGSVYSSAARRGSASAASDMPSLAHKYASPHIGQIDSSDKLDADTMDEKRKEHIAYEYLCHLEEAKKWIEVCIEDELPPTTELEEALRNGVILARLGHYYGPEILPLRKIYDRDQAKYRAKGLHFKHTDNFNWWLRTLENVGLPKIFYPITTDLYDRKNMPRVIYCIHALSLYLHKLGKAPLIEDLLGTATFTEEEISAMKLALERYGINMPSFGKIGGILANEMSVDEAAVHAAVMAINEVLEKEDDGETLKALQNPAACLVDVQVENAQRYQPFLLNAKREKGAAAVSQNGNVDDSERDVYEYMLTRDEIQKAVTDVNATVRAEIAEAKFCTAIAGVNQAIASGGLSQLLQAMQNEDTRLRGVHPENVQWYMDILSKAIKDKAEMGGEGALTHEEIQDIINIANDIAEHTRLVQAALVSINAALEAGDTEATLEALKNEHLDLSEVHTENKDYYFQGLLAKKQEKAEAGGRALLTEDEIQEGVHEMNHKAEHDRSVTHAYIAINESLQSDDPQATLNALKSKFAGLDFVRDDYAQLYHTALRQAWEEKGENLTQEEIKKIVEEVNEQKHLEELLSEAVEQVNSCLDGSDSEALLQALHNQYGGLQNIQDSNALHYLTVLSAMKAAKVEKTGNASAQLTQQEIQAGINRANEQTLEAIELAKAVSAINQAVEEGDAEATLEALKAPAANLRSITDTCAEDYASSLAQARQQKTESGAEVGDGWTEHRTREGHSFYYNWKSGESQWGRPEELPGQNAQLSRDEIQVVVTKVTADYDRWALLKANEPLIVQLQARLRGNQCRKAFTSRLDYLTAHEQQAIKLQAHWKGSKQRKAYNERLEYLKKQSLIAIKLQSLVRMWKARAAYRKRLQFFRSHVDAVIKIQAFWRAKSAKRDYKQLVEVDQPPASTVRRFLALLEQSDIDFSEELECQRMKAQVVQEIRSNQQLEQDLHIMDIKIGLLVKNRITLEDVVSHSSQIKKERRRGTVSTATGEGGVSTTGLGGLTKANQETLEAYQHLFYLLQTNPNYFARLIFEMPQSKTNRFMENVILTVFNYAQNNREQFLLAKLFERALKEEIESKVDKIMDIVTGNPTVIKMVIHYTRGERDQNVLRELLGPLVQEVLQAKDLVLVTSPVEVYRAWINQTETETGEASKLPYEVSNDQALEHEEVRVKIRKTVELLCSFCDRFQRSILEAVNKIPYTMRFIAMQLRLALHSKFPDAPEDDILKVVGNLLYYRYMNPAIVAPDAFDVVEMGVEQQLGAEQRRNLGVIAKILQTAAAGKLFEGENSALSNMNTYLTEAFEKFKQFFLKASTVPTAEEKFGIDEYSDVIMLTKPVIYISVKEVCSTHSLLIEHEDAIAPLPNDPLREILKDLGSSPSVESLLGGVRDTAPGEDKQDLVDEAGKQEIPLTLVNKFGGLAQDDSSDMKALFVRTKRMVVDVLKVQPGENLTEVLYTPATPEQEEEHQQLIKKREQSEQEQMLRSKTIKKSDSMSGDRNLPLEGMKRKIMRNLRTLETENMVNSKNDYQEIINAIAKDIRNQHRYRQQRKQELARLQETLTRLNTKATFYEEQIEYYQKYVKACLDNLAQTGGRKVRKAPTEGRPQSIKYTALRLHEKGVILEIEGLPTHQFKNVVFVITAKDVGTFEVSGKFLGVSMDKVELVFQDLLQLQYEGLAVMKMFGRAKINVNLLIYLINKKFYGIHK